MTPVRERHHARRRRNDRARCRRRDHAPWLCCLHDRGQALPIVVGVVAVLAALVAGMGWFAAGLHDAAQARTAADAAALAGVEGGATGAATLAGANGGRLVSFVRTGDDVVVRVRVGRATATARATNGP